MTRLLVFPLPRQFAKFQWGNCPTRERFDLQKSTRLPRCTHLVPMCETDFPLWRLRSLAYSIKTISLHPEKWEIKKREKKEREVDTIKLFTTYSFRLQIKRYGTGEWNKEFTTFLTWWKVAKTSCLNGFHLISATHSLCSFVWKRFSPLG